MARRKVKAKQGAASRGESAPKLDVDSRAEVLYADDEPSAFASMLGGLIEANVRSHSEKQRDFDSLKARVGIWGTDIDEVVTLELKGGTLIVHTSLKPRRTLTSRTDAYAVLNLTKR